MLSDHPRMLSMNPSLLRNPQGESHPLLENGSLRLAAWLVSGDPQQQRDYQALLNTPLKTSKLKELESVMARPGESLIAGVERELDPISTPITEILNFLSYLYDSGLEYSTINGYRSALSFY